MPWKLIFTWSSTLHCDTGLKKIIWTFKRDQNAQEKNSSWKMELNIILYYVQIQKC